MANEKLKLLVTFLTILLLISVTAFVPLKVNAVGEETYVVASDFYANSNFILSNEDGTFGNQEYMGQAPQPYYSCGCGIGDFDNDGDLDYVIGTGYKSDGIGYEPHVYLYEKLGSGNNFAAPVSVGTWTEGWYPMDFAVADYNKDGKMDFILTHYGSSNSELYLGNADLTFTSSVLSDTSPFYSIGADSADFNNDGNPDFATATYGSPPIEDIRDPGLPYPQWPHNPYSMYISLGNGDGAFTTTTFEASDSTWGLAAGDFDNDGNADIITAYYGPWYFYKGNGDGTFQPGIMIVDVDSYYSPLDNFDFDNDGDQDIIMGYLQFVRYYTGNGDATFTLATDIIGGSGDWRYAISAPPSQREPGAPHAIATPEYQLFPLEGGMANFDGSSSYDEDGWIADYQWDFGDGFYGTGAIVSHVYSAQVEEITYRAKLTVTDNDGKKSYDAVIVKIGNTPPKVICVPWRFGLPHETWNGNTAILKAAVRDMDLPLTYTWNFGDGNSESGTIITENEKYAVEATHTYPDAPEWTPFTAILTVSDRYGASSSDMYQIVVKTKTLDAEVNVAIDDGLWWLHKTQTRLTTGGIDCGFWYDVGYYVAPTSTAVLAFEIQGHLTNGDADEDPYVETVQRGLNYIFTKCYAQSISGPNDLCPYGNPDTNGNGIGISIDSNRPVYEIGTAMMAIAASGDLNRVATSGPTDVIGRTYFAILTDMVDMCAWGQNEIGSGRGGWRYFWNSGDSDNSVTQWPIIGLEAAEANWGIQAPSFVKTELDLWLLYSQSTTGGFGYTAPEGWVNPAKTGAGIAGLAYIGLPSTDTRVVNAINYLNSQWGTSGTDGYWDNYYALYAIMKGCRLSDPEVQYIGAHDWYGDDPDGFARYLVNEQWADGRWPQGAWAGYALDSGWAILILTPTVVFPPPVANAGPDVTWGPDWPLDFDGSGSYHLDPTKNIVLYEWDFESDGIFDYSSATPYAQHMYPTYYNPDGSINEALTYRDYTVTLRVTDDNVPAKTDTDVCIVHITPPPHPPIADPDGPYTGYQGHLISLDGSGSYDIDSGSPWFDYIVSYGWELDMVWPYDFDDAIGATVGWIWDVQGTHNIGLRVSDTTSLTHTAWTTVTIIQPPPEIWVYFDIKPSSWPNPINLVSKGVLPVAICGTDDFDVMTIDPATVKLTREGLDDGVPPIRWAYEDVATPWTDEHGGGHALGGDGYLDLTLKFSTQEVVMALGLDAFMGQKIPLIITGKLKPEVGGTPIMGQDYVWILRLPGDVNDSMLVSIADMAEISAHWTGVGSYVEYADLDGNGVISISDMSIVSAHWAESWQP